MAQTFGEGFAQGVTIGNLFRQRNLEKSIDDAGMQVQQEMQIEKDVKAQQERANEKLLSNIKPTQTQEAPGIYQQGDSLGLTGYQTGNKPIQTTVPTAPPGYQSRGDNMTDNDLSPGGLEYPSANPATEQTLLGNYGTAASFKGEKPTTEDIRMMQKDTPRPFMGPQDKSVLDLADVSANKPEAVPQETNKPKMLDNLNEYVTAADRAKESYDYNMRVVRKLQESGNARAALEYQSKVANAELTLTQADHSKFVTASAVAKTVGNMADNALELIQQGADVNKTYFDTMSRAKNELGYGGNIPFSMDPRENIKTLQRLQKDSLTTSEKAELGIKQSVAAQKSVIDKAELSIKQEKLTLDKINTGLAMTKENREQATASFNRLAENVKLQFQALNSINSVMDEDYKKALKPSYDANLKTLQQYSKALNIPMPNIAVATPGSALPTPNTQPGMANVQPEAAPTAANPSPNTQPVNNAFPADVIQEAGVASEAGGFVPPPPKSKEQVAKDTPRIQFLKNKINELESKTKTKSAESSVAISNPLQDVVNLGSRTIASIGRSDILNPSKVGKRERDRAEKELKKYKEELDKLQ